LSGTLSEVQSGTPSSASWPVQECQCSVLCSGTIGPEFCAAAAPLVSLAAGLDDELAADPAEVQAAMPSRAAKPMASAAGPRTGRLPARDIDMSPIMPEVLCRPAGKRLEPLRRSSNQDAARSSRCRSSSALRYSATTMFVSSSTEVSLLYLS
jgi:hypothetical protein